MSRLAAASGAWEDFDDLDQIATRVVAKEPPPRENEFDVIPTVVRPSLGRKVIGREPVRAAAARSANVDDVVEELRAAAAGRKPRVRELESADLLDENDGPDEVQEVDVSELVFDRVVPPREVWNVRQVPHGTAPRPSIVGPTSAPTSRFLLTAALAMLGGALLAVAVAFVVWRFSGISL